MPSEYTIICWGRFPVTIFLFSAIFITGTIRGPLERVIHLQECRFTPKITTLARRSFFVGPLVRWGRWFFRAKCQMETFHWIRAWKKIWIFRWDYPRLLQCMVWLFTYMKGEKMVLFSKGNVRNVSNNFPRLSVWEYIMFGVKIDPKVSRHLSIGLMVEPSHAHEFPSLGTWSNRILRVSFLVAGRNPKGKIAWFFWISQTTSFGEYLLRWTVFDWYVLWVQSYWTSGGVWMSAFWMGGYVTDMHLWRDTVDRLSYSIWMMWFFGIIKRYASPLGLGIILFWPESIYWVAYSCVSTLPNVGQSWKYLFMM